MLTQLTALASAAEPLARPTAIAACAAFDLHVLLKIEAAGIWQTMHPADLLAAVESVMTARRACTDGHFAQAARIYEGLDLGPSAPDGDPHLAESAASALAASARNDPVRELSHVP